LFVNAFLSSGCGKNKSLVVKISLRNEDYLRLHWLFFFRLSSTAWTVVELSQSMGCSLVRFFFSSSLYTEVLTEGISFLPITCLFSSCFIVTLLFIFDCGFGYNTGQFSARLNQILPQHQILRERLQKHNLSFISICIGESSLAVTMKLHYKFVFSLAINCICFDSCGARTWRSFVKMVLSSLHNFFFFSIWDWKYIRNPKDWHLSCTTKLIIKLNWDLVCSFMTDRMIWYFTSSDDMLHKISMGMDTRMPKVLC